MIIQCSFEFGYAATVLMFLIVILCDKQMKRDAQLMPCFRSCDDVDYQYDPQQSSYTVIKSHESDN